MLVNNLLGMPVIDTFGNKEQKERLLTAGINFEANYGFGLTEPGNGSDASGLKTEARKVEGGWILNGEKMWIGNATIGHVVTWAKNMEDGGKV